jgi:hypothetical protein
MTPKRIALVAPILALLLACGLSAFPALALGGALGGTAIGIAPEPVFGLTDGLLCTGDARLEYFSVRRSYHLPGESEPHLECVEPDGARHDVLPQGIVIVVLGAIVAVFAGSFVTLAIPFALAAWFVGRGWRSRGP